MGDGGDGREWNENATLSIGLQSVGSQVTDATQGWVGAPSAEAPGFWGARPVLISGRSRRSGRGSLPPGQGAWKSMTRRVGPVRTRIREQSGPVRPAAQL